MAHLYRPSPLEEVYGLYLLETCFQIPEHNETFALSGRLAVPFFTKSQVNRLILRNVWSTVDPDNQGYLSTHPQFHTSLRLIALAQVGVLQRWLADAFHDGQPQASPVAAMQACLQATQGNVIALPKFEGIDIPDGTVLLTRYQRRHLGDLDLHAVPIVPAAVRNSMTPQQPISSGDDPFGSLPLMQSSTYSFNDPNSVASFSPMNVSSMQSALVSDNSATLSAPPTDRASAGVDPLGSLANATAISDPFSSSTTTPAWTGPPSTVLPPNTAEASFPIFGPAVAPAGSATGSTVPIAPLSATIRTVSISDAFGGLVDVNDEPLPSLPAAEPSKSESAVQSMGGDDEFGDFGEAVVVNERSKENGTKSLRSSTDASHVVTSSMAPLHESSSRADDFGDFCGSEEFAAPASTTAATAKSEHAAPNPPSVWGFGVDLPTTEGFAPVTQVASGDWDALDALADIPDAPLPVLPLPEPISEPRASDDTLEAFVEDESFGDFEAIQVEELHQPESKQQASDQTTETAEPDLQPNNVEAMDSIPAEVDHKHSVEESAIGATSSVSVEVAAVDENQSFDLHGFGTSLQVQGLSALDAFGELENAPLPSLDHFQPTAEFELESTQQQEVEDESDDFGDFVGLEHATRTQSETIPITAPREGKTDGHLSSGSEGVTDADGFGDFVSVDEDDAFRQTNKSLRTDELLLTRNFILPSKSWGGNEAVLIEPYPLERHLSAPAPNGQVGMQTAKPGQDETNRSTLVVSPLGDATDMQPFSAPSKEPSFDAFDGLPGTICETAIPQPSDDSIPFAVAAAGSTGDHKKRQATASDGAQDSEELFPASRNDLPSLASDVVPVVERESLRSDDRLESEYFSASGSTSDDLEGFESAAETDEEGHVLKANDDLPGRHSRFGELGQATCAAEYEDPFAVLDELSPPFSAIVADGTSSTSMSSPHVAPTQNTNHLLDALKNPSHQEPARLDHFPEESTEARQINDSDTPQITLPEQSIVVTENSESDTFGDFESADFDLAAPAHEGSQVDASQMNSAPSTTTKSDVHASFEPNESFGDFASCLPSAPSPLITAGLSDDNAPLKAAKDIILDIKSDTNVESLSLNTGEDDFGDFASFSQEGAAAPQQATPNSPQDESEKEKLLLIRQLVVDHSLRLPEAIRRQTGGSLLNFGDCFDANVGLDVPVSMERKNRTQTCLELIALLTTSHVKLGATFWEQSLSVVRTELEQGCSLLKEAKGFAHTEVKVFRTKMERYVHGLGEFVRITRAIVATVGELLMLDPSDLFTIDTLASSWCNLELLQTALEIERLWRSVETASQELGLTSKQETQLKLSTVEEIRRSSAAASRAGLRCELTLQPISPSQSTCTTSPVEWNSRKFMACCANFLQHKCPSYAIDTN